MSGIRNTDELTRAVRAVMRRTPEPRLREIMDSLVSHLHGFVKDVQLTEDEFRAATALIARMGQLTNERHNEVVLMAGSLGVSSLVCLLNNGQAQADGSVSTTQNLLGPFWRVGSPRTASGGSILRCPTAGEPLWVQARVVDADGRPVPGVEVDVWQCDAEGHYENQAVARAKGMTDMNLRGSFSTDGDGRFSFWSVKPLGYPIPTDGVVGQLLAAQGRHPFRPAHVHVLAHKAGYKTLISQVYAHDDPNLATDAQFGATDRLTATFVRHSGPPPPEAPREASVQTGVWHSVDFSFVLLAGESRLPKPPIL
ncbi:MAG: catechol 1,2-dioxygenase [Pseudomonadota bacterium]|jgi:catechol 1,2-dioxygenase